MEYLFRKIFMLQVNHLMRRFLTTSTPIQQIPLIFFFSVWVSLGNQVQSRSSNTILTLNVTSKDLGKLFWVGKRPNKTAQLQITLIEGWRISGVSPKFLAPDSSYWSLTTIKVNETIFHNSCQLRREHI